ncbi:transposable element Tcb1 transposase [Trichonephila clavipes]|uniref:Transposable element Tcb1 transposase n=1 Tax=Trichonephila clavipes TaxID=2585209 RepID=A0A8X6SVT0_TRICX|nr:transposable element Tcb1 transposase [Trichonephila clavipes]
MFSDESRFSLQSDSRLTLIWTATGTRYHQENTIERHRYGGAGWLVWGGIILGSRTDLLVQSVTMTGYIYRDVILEQHVRLFRGAMGAEFLIMNENARPHRANIVDECLQSEDISRMNWPAYSPDLNPIEHVWDMLGRRIAARQPPPTCLPELRRALCLMSGALFENYISRYGAPISLISDNGPQFISDVFKHLSHRLDIKHIKTVTYRPQCNLTEKVNRTLVQIIAYFVEENHDNWDRFLHEFSFALRRAINETTGKTLAELFLGRKIITPFRKLVLVTNGAEYVGGNIEKLFDEVRQNMHRQHKTWGKYYNRKRREVNIKVNDSVLVQAHFISAAGRRVVGKFMPKFKGPYRVLEVQNNNLIIWKKGRRVTVNVDQVRIYHSRNSKTSSYDSINETTYEGKESSNWSNRSNSEKSRRSRKPSGNENKSCKSDKGNAVLEDLRVKRDRAVVSTGTLESTMERGQKYAGSDHLEGLAMNSIERGKRLYCPREPEILPGTSNQGQTKRSNPPKQKSSRKTKVESERTRESRPSTNRRHSAAEGRPVRSRRKSTVRHLARII